MIKISNLSKSYEQVHAVKDVSLEIKKGEIVGLLGRNGAGKTTIMKMLTGFLEPSAGTITLNGKDIIDSRMEVQNILGYMPENAPLYPEMLVQEYLIMMAELRQIPQEKQISLIIEAVKSTGLSDFLTRPIGTLSKGYKQRVGICQAIIHNPEILILDEPTNGLDPVQIIEIRNLIKKLAENATVILSTHILQEIEAVCDRVIILIDGELAKDAPLKDFLSSNTISLYLESAITETQISSLAKDIKGLGDVKQEKGEKRLPNYNLWTIAWEAENPPVNEIIKAISQNGWNSAGISANPPSLEKAFSQLMYEHGTRKMREIEA
ncbi:MAG: ABC transporter ATP-binding protein [Deltaproteobacteria bacterium]|nr:ABC transporter ATP-binding protein [Deltaproteobacteria bacterium]